MVVSVESRRIEEGSFRHAPARGPATGLSAMVATSQSPATLAGIETLRRGGSAADAAIAAAAVLCVAEPMSTGIGGDAFALVADRDEVAGLDAAGPAPRDAAREPVDRSGPRSVVVPGAVSGWAALSERYGRLGLDTVLGPAIDLAATGVAAGPNCARAWEQATNAPPELGPPPGVGGRIELPELAASLRAIADGGPDAFYRGPIAEAIASTTWLAAADLDEYADAGATWVEPLWTSYRGVEVFELGPPTQGIAALEGLALLHRLEPTLENQVRVCSLALQDALDRVRDGADVADLLGERHLTARLRDAPLLGREPGGGTVYLCAVDGDGLAVSFIQSLYEGFGSGVVAPGTGIVLNNRAACFEVAGAVAPGRRPYHTIIPGMLAEGGAIRGPFGVMGGFIQAQAHVQLVSGLIDDDLDPQAALDRPRFRIDGGTVALEEGLWPAADRLADAGYATVRGTSRASFGGGQAIQVLDGRLLGGSDARKDGFAAGL